MLSADAITENPGQRNNGNRIIKICFFSSVFLYNSQEAQVIIIFSVITINAPTGRLHHLDF